ncbi:hypothetical protein [Pseudogracilibacillus auburnensis]|uniref:hypothetical protein n=1 Tax=Pseudogracilibacillus auburnensis TaxID=1494959 RepID=UPI001A9786F9|nr:hypothetical protein [Pseudogracilibacillus auburnensis]MBO1005972.1 hypothetical protein [Pseudogracilibacillus auburnensis]
MRLNIKIGLRLVIVIVVIAVSIYFFLIRGMTQDVDWLRISDVVVSDDTITINAFNPNSALKVSGCDFYIKDQTVYLKFRAKLSYRLGESFVTENIVIIDNFSNVYKVVLQGKANRSETIWSN